MGWSWSPVPGRVGRLVTGTLAMTYLLVLLGVYTAAEGAGLTCAGRWPLCDGAVFGLFPATWPSFVEWFHRLIAMVTGFLILASAVAVWRARVPRRAVGAVALAVVLLPLQIWAGAQTVLTYEVVILTAHFLIALAIYTALLAGVIWTIAPPTVARRRLARWLAGALVLVVPFVLLGPRILLVHTGAVQVAYYGLGVLVLTVLVATALLVHRGPGVDGSDRWAVTGSCAVAGVALAAKLLAGRLVFTGAIQTLDAVATGVVVVATLVAAGVLYGGVRRWLGGRDTRPA